MAVSWNKVNRLFTRLLDRKFVPFNTRYLAHEATTENNDKDTHFGFQTVKASEKHKKVYEVFENVANKYDLMNDAMSMGIHRFWKDYFMLSLSPTDNTKLLDVAGGTGDISFRFLNYVKNENLKNCHVTVLDINPHMLDVGQQRSKALKHDPNMIAWKEGNAEQLDLEDDSFDAYTIAFGIRNCTYIDKVLSEAYRVLKPGGRFMCMEFSHVHYPYFQWLYDKYSFQVVPVMGQILAGDWNSYQYLVESIRQFPTQENFKLMIEEAGFRSNNPFEEEDVDDETFLRNSRRPPPSTNNAQPTFEDQMQSFAEKKRAIEERTVTSTERSISILRDSEQIGIATAEELSRQREKLEKTDKQLDEINSTLRFSQKHINGIKSVFSSLKNYMAGRSDSPNSTTSSSTPSTVKQSTSNQNLEEKLSTYDRYDNHPATRLRERGYDEVNHSSSGSKDFSARLDANLQEMCSNITRLKGLASELGTEIDSQNDLIGNITDKAELADITITRQNKDMARILKK
ncbi:unnamed protein product [Phyllotreta striolata]|uniref:2-methoxy-6-polyprenyl-1,4-benzoquinol methylase, mitochondrial n=1 Tax=Phyllotreta striolata TaxID=444603 RepID=A0A9N9TSX3_PHYSR|nr:unnamed protein product [Phyllotreta striolata]